MTSARLDTRADEIRTLPDALQLRRERQSDDVAYVSLRDGEVPDETLTYGELADAAHERAVRFAALGLAGHTAVLLYPSGLEFVRTLLGCMTARTIGAPVQVPRRRDGLARIRRIADDAGATAILTTAAVKRDLQDRFGDAPELAGLTLHATDEPAITGLAELPEGPRPDDIALLQYTSGSTGEPKGVMVTHRNFLHNARETAELWPLEPDATVVNWLPLFHDMGMLFGVVMPLWGGIPSYLMAPDSFIRRPARWLEAIARFGGTHSAAPSFAYELCVRAAADGQTGDVGDLSRWRVAANGAEPVRRHVITAFLEAFAPHGFTPWAMCPGYGLAENTLKVTGTDEHRPPRMAWLAAGPLGDGIAEFAAEPGPDTLPAVGSGSTVPGTTVRIVDPATRRECPPGHVGEIWVSGPCVAAGYWNRPELSEEIFRARIEGGDATGYLRTGDLGFVHDGDLFVTGRQKDVIIRKGRNFYPQDIEESAQHAVDGLHPNCAAAFSVDDGSSERLIVLVEVDGRVARVPGIAAAHDAIRAAIWDRHRLEADEILLVRRGTLSRTSSGKVQRRACRQRYESGALTPLTAEAQR
ncbi:fatty acyl-AMP ligase [Micromonospora sp. NBC_00617]|uniref:fatty acyl-AMP ligase n=1 Tax=Micromonospora sp. NBC_00617 TaxID=2903587 RepID=UPI0030DF34B2